MTATRDLPDDAATLLALISTLPRSTGSAMITAAVDMPAAVTALVARNLAQTTSAPGQ